MSDIVGGTYSSPRHYIYSEPPVNGEALDAEPVELTVETMQELPPGRRVVDAQGDIWTKQSPGAKLWRYQMGKDVVLFEDSWALHRVWGPLKLIPEEGI